MPDYVIFVVAKGQVESSMNIIEDLYYGRIAPYEVSMTATPEFECFSAEEMTPKCLGCMA